MAKVDSQGRSKGGYGRYNNYDHSMILSEAFLSLSGDAVKVFMHVRTRYTEDKHQINNNGEISYSVREGEKVHLSKNRTSRALKELEEKGFLKVKDDSTFDQKKLARTWIITCEKYNKKPPTRDFKNWNIEKDQKQNPVPPAGQHSPTSGTPKENKLSIVPPAGLQGIKAAASQSHQWDTYNIPLGDGEDIEPVPKPINKAHPLLNTPLMNGSPSTLLALRSGVTTHNASKQGGTTDKALKERSCYALQTS